MGNPPPLPTFVRPMLAQPGRAFDSDQHLFEIKWDGIRALAFVEHAGYRLVSRHGLGHRQFLTPYPGVEGFGGV